jgi:mono/diheme cytochrome c family protein
MRFFLTATLVAGVAGSLLPLVAAPQEAAAGPEMPGRAVYNDTCSRCHGPEGQGGRAPWLVPFGWNYSQAIDVVRHGGPCGMPAYTEAELSDEQVKQIVDYLKTFN